VENLAGLLQECNSSDFHGAFSAAKNESSSSFLHVQILLSVKQFAAKFAYFLLLLNNSPFSVI